MPPLDDELRAALHGRAATLAPSPDPLAGIERRARGMRRRRVGASVAGTALAVLAVAGAVPLLAPDRTGAPDPSRMATSAPTSAPTAVPYALDLDDPWEYRGDRAVLGSGNLETWQREWAVRHPGAELVPLFGQVWEPSGQPELVFASRLPGTDRLAVGVAQTGESGPRFLTTERYAPLLSVPVVLSGDEVPRLLLVAAPGTARLQYAPDGERFEDLATLAPGVATVAVEQPPGRSDLYQVVGERGELVEQGPVADEPATDLAEPVVDAAPANVLDWEPRGTIDGQVVLAARAAYAAGRRGAVDDVQEKVLFAGDDDAGRRYLVGQFWLVGDETADTFAVVRSADGEVEPQSYRPARPDTPVVALYLSPPNDQSRGELVVVPRPGTGQVQYAGDQASEWVDKDTPGLDGVVLLTRNPEAERTEGPDDRLRLLDGDGEVTAQVSVRDLLCGATSCS